MSKETRQEMVKSTKKLLETARQHIRRARQDGLQSVKSKKDEFPQDDLKRIQDAIQKTTDANTSKAQDLFAIKEKDLLAV